MDNNNFSEDYIRGFVDGHGMGFIKGTHEGFIIGKGHQAKEVREKFASLFGEGLQYMKVLKKIEQQGENISKTNEIKIKEIWSSISIKDNA